MAPPVPCYLIRHNISVFSAGSVYTPGVDDTFADNAASDVTFSNASIEAALNTNNVILQANNNISWSGALSPTGTFDLTLQAGNTISIFDTQGILSTNGGNLTLIANSTLADGVVDAQRDAGTANILIGDGIQTATIDTAGGNIVMEIRDGAGLTNNTAGEILIDIASVSSGNGNIDLIAPEMNITAGSSLNAGTGVVNIRPFVNGSAINIAAAADPDASTLHLTSTELGLISASNIIVGNINSGVTTIAGNFTLPGMITLNGPTSNWNVGAVITGGGNTLELASGSVLNITGTGSHTFSNLTFNNNGTVNYNTSASDFELNDNTVFNNNGLFDIQANIDINSISGTATFNNNSGATLRKSAGTGTSSIVSAIAFNNTDATIDNVTGNIQLPGTGSFTNVTTITGNPLILNGTHSFNGGSSATGTLNLIGGSLNAVGSLTLDNINVSGGSLTSNGNTIINGTFDWSGGTLDGTGTLTTNAASSVSTSAVHTLNTAWTNNNTVTWSQGTIDGTGSLINAVSLDMTSAFSMTLDGASIDNQGTTTYSGGGNFLLENGAVFTNNGTFDYQSANGNINTATSGLFDNFGTIQRSVNTGSASIQVAFNTNTGTIIDGISEALDFGAMNIVGDFSTQNFGATLTGGTHTITNNSTLLSGTLNWDTATGGLSTLQATSSETLTLAIGTSFNIDGGFSRTLDNAGITNLGTTTYLGNGGILLENGAVFTNNGTFDYQSANGNISTSAFGLFDNYGTIQRSVNTGSASFLVAFNANAGTVIDGISEAMKFGAMNIVGDFSTQNFGATLTGGTHTLSNNSSLLSGTLNWDTTTGGLSTLQDISAETLTIASGASLNILGGFSKTLSNATIDNQGTTTYLDSGNFLLENGATFLNNGTFDFQSANGVIDTATTGLFDNFGTIQRSVNTGSGSILVIFNVQTGSLIDGISEALEFQAMNYVGDFTTQNFGATMAGGTHTITNNSSLLAGTLNWDTTTGGLSTLTGSGVETLTIASGATLNIDGGFSRTLDSAGINNQGTTIYLGNGGFVLENAAVFTNSGTFDYQSNNGLISTTTSALFDNSGTIQRTTNTGSGSVQIAFNANTGTIIDGVSEALEFTAMNIVGDISTLNFGGTLAGGTHTITDGSSLLSGTLNWDNTSGGTSTLQGTGIETFTIANGATFNIAGGLAKILDNATIDNQGTTNFVSGGNFEINNAGSFINNTTGVFDFMFNGDITFATTAGTFINLGTLKKSAGDGVSEIFVNYTNTGGAIEIAGLNTFGLGGAALTLDAGSSLRGNGTFQGDVNNAGGSVEPGVAAVAGILTIDGNYSGSAGDITIKVESAFNDQLVITGSGDFSNTTLVLVDNGATITDGTNLASTISTAGAPVNFATVSNPFAGFDASSVINGNDIDILFSIIISNFIWTGGGDGTSWNDPATGTSSAHQARLIMSVLVRLMSPYSTDADANTLVMGATGSLTLAGGTFTLGSNSALDGTFIVSGGTLDITGATLTINNAMNWTGTSTINGGGTGSLVIAAAAVLTMSNNVNHVLSNVTLDNQGTTNYATGSGTFFFLNDGAIFDNNGVFDFQADAIVSSGSANGVFNNNASGQILKTAGAGNSAFGSGVSLTNNDALFDASSGGIELQGTTTMNGVLTNTGSDLRFNSSNISFADGSSVNGNLALVGGTVNILGTTTMNDTLNWSGTSTIAGPGTLVMAAGSVLTLTGNVNHILSNITLNNQGTTNYATGGGTFLFLNNGAIFDNNGVFDFQADATVSSGTLDGVFNNNASGQILKTAGAGNSAFGSGVSLTNNDGLFDASSGGIELQGTTTMNGVLS